MDRPLRGALIGCGYVSRFHLDAWGRVPDAELVAACDIRPERRDWVVSRWPHLHVADDLGALLAAVPSLDFVEICTRPGAHRPLTEQAAAEGLHVLCQKPAAETREDLLGMIAACDRAGTRLMIHENWRVRPWYRELRRQLDAGSVGRPIRLRLSHRDTRALRADGFASQPYFAEMPRLILLEMGPHLVDTARFLLGEVAAVRATLGQFGPGHPGEDLALLDLTFASGALGLLEINWCAPPDLARPEWALNETAVEGTEATLRLRVDGSWQRNDLDGRTELLPVTLPATDEEVYLQGYIATQSHFIDGIRQGTPHETSGADTLRTMDVIWAGYASAEQGRTIRL